MLVKATMSHPSLLVSFCLCYPFYAFSSRRTALSTFCCKILLCSASQKGRVLSFEFWRLERVPLGFYFIALLIIIIIYEKFYLTTYYVQSQFTRLHIGSFYSANYFETSTQPILDSKKKSRNVWAFEVNKSKPHKQSKLDLVSNN